MKIGASLTGAGGCEFVVWAPTLEKVTLRIVTPRKKTVAMNKDDKGYWTTTVESVSAGARYCYRLKDIGERPDPASHFQPEGVHGYSEVVDHDSFQWTDADWQGVPLPEMVIYEVHAGTFTPEGTFDALIERLADIVAVGVNTIELMPVAQFPGERNWGYDGVYLFAPQNSYGGPEELKKLVDECHRKGIAVLLDVVYNHLGPEGNYLREYGPYFTDKYRTPWGSAVNFDDAWSDGVRNFFTENALHWYRHYHIDGLRLDAIHGITDMSARPFLRELAESVEEFSAEQGKRRYLIAESDLNDAKVVSPMELGGYGFDALWCDDFHHAVHTLLTGERKGYYLDFGRPGHLVKSLTEGFVYAGDYSQFRKRRHGNSSKDRPSHQFVVFCQNHDQVGNRMLGERLSSLVSLESLKLAAGTVLLSPYVPLLFMGEEYGEEAPFLYFVSHSEPDLIEAVRRGRSEEFKAFAWQSEPPDPQDKDTFLRSKLHWKGRLAGNHRILLDFYTHLIAERKRIPALSHLERKCLEAYVLEDDGLVVLRRWKDDSHVFCLLNFNEDDRRTVLSLPESGWKKVLDSSEKRWKGPGHLLPEEISGDKKVTVRGRSFAVYHRGSLS
jgi:maltooligosyltrehalose trehalohydrolase